MSLRTVSLSLPIALLILVSSPLALANQAEIDARRTTLEACAERELRKTGSDRPRKSKDVLRACASEAKAFFDTLAPGAVSEYRKHVEHVIQHRLDQ